MPLITRSLWIKQDLLLEKKTKRQIQSLRKGGGIIETKHGETKRNTTKRNETCTLRNETKSVL